MRVAFLGFLSLLFTVSVSYGCIAKVNWGNTLKNDNVWANCSADSTLYVGGFNRSSNGGAKDTVDRIGEAWCLGPFESDSSYETNCTTANWNMKRLVPPVRKVSVHRKTPEISLISSANVAEVTWIPAIEKDYNQNNEMGGTTRWLSGSQISPLTATLLGTSAQAGITSLVSTNPPVASYPASPKRTAADRTTKE